MAPLKIALFGACADAAWRLAERLNKVLAESGNQTRVVAFDAAAADLDILTFDAIFLRGLQSSGSADRSWQVADDLIRAALRQAGIPYQVLYGSDAESVEQLMRAIENLGTAAPITAAPAQQSARGLESARPWVWLCDKCSDPQCEHRLLTDLLEQRQTRFTT